MTLNPWSWLKALLKMLSSLFIREKTLTPSKTTSASTTDQQPVSQGTDSTPIVNGDPGERTGTEIMPEVYPDPPSPPPKLPKNQLPLNKESTRLHLAHHDVVLDRLFGLLNRVDELIDDATNALSSGINQLGLVGLGENRVLDLRQRINGPESELGDISEWHFLGDIHGDFYSLWLAIETVIINPRNGLKGRICFLGDLVDRGPCDLACLLLVLETAKQHPNHFAWIGGNHDVLTTMRWPKELTKEQIQNQLMKERNELIVQLRRNLGEVGKRGPSVVRRFNELLDYISFPTEEAYCAMPFKAPFSPAEFTDWANEEDQGWITRKTGELFVRIAEQLPRAIVFPQGIFASHAGIPLDDRHENLTSIAAFDADKIALGDLCWVRWGGSYPENRSGHREPRNKEKRSAGGSEGFMFSIRNVKDFRDAMKNNQVFDIKALVRGHDHENSGYSEHYWKNSADPSDFIQILTMTGSRHSSIVTSGVPDALIMGSVRGSDSTLGPIHIQKIAIAPDGNTMGLLPFYKNIHLELPGICLSGKPDDSPGAKPGDPTAGIGDLVEQMNRFIDLVQSRLSLADSEPASKGLKKLDGLMHRLKQLSAAIKNQGDSNVTKTG